MSYYKITYESDSIEGLRALQGGSSSKGDRAANTKDSENSSPAPPPLQTDSENADAFSAAMPPPPTNSDANRSADEGTMQDPPPLTANPGAMDVDADMPLPPLGE